MSLDTVIALATVGTAVGTSILALATFRLARRTGALVDQAQAQATVSAASLEAQSQPLIADVRTHDLVGVREPMLGDIGPMRCPLRNVGPGPAKVVHVCIAASGQRFPGVSDLVVLPSGDDTFFRPNIPEPRPVEKSLGRAFSIALEGSAEIEYQVAYTTPAGTQLTVSKARMINEVAVGEEGGLEWRVRDVNILYGDDARTEAEHMRRDLVHPEWEVLPVRRPPSPG